LKVLKWFANKITRQQLEEQEIFKAGEEMTTNNKPKALISILVQSPRNSYKKLQITNQPFTLPAMQIP
jgi:hypothetical protein